MALDRSNDIADGRRVIEPTIPTAAGRGTRTRQLEKFARGKCTRTPPPSYPNFGWGKRSTERERERKNKTENVYGPTRFCSRASAGRATRRIRLATTERSSCTAAGVAFGRGLTPCEKETNKGTRENERKNDPAVLPHL